MVLTNDKKIYLKCKSLRNLCFGIGKERFNHDDIGWNYRMSNLQAAMGCGQLKNIFWTIKKKRSIGERYYNHLKHTKTGFEETNINEKMNRINIGPIIQSVVEDYNSIYNVKTYLII